MAGVRPNREDARLETPPALLGSGMTHAVVVRLVTGHLGAFSPTAGAMTSEGPWRMSLGRHRGDGVARDAPAET